MDKERLLSQLAFIAEIDRLKGVYRQTYLLDGSRKENDAEHSWHLAIMAVLLAEYANKPGIDIFKVVKMVLIHDLVEIDAGDTFCYGPFDPGEKSRRENEAAARLFSLLPADQKEEFNALWIEFEARDTAEARFAASLDRLQPLYHNYVTRGKSWLEHGVSKEKVLERNEPIKEGSVYMWDFARDLIEDAFKKGYLL
ncbi:MAG TPA: HD domain-containing protein [Firmicutes bacterium]|nr:HD domain-containing protein [Bacillota bacterium]